MTTPPPAHARFLEALNAHRNGTGWKGRCPAHDDEHPSLSIAVAADGTLLFHCHAGCAQNDVLDALRARGLWPPVASGPNGRAPGGGGPGAPVTRYEYRDAAGRLVAVHERTDFPAGAKRFVWRLPDGRVSKGQLKTADLPLYGLADLLAAAPDAGVLLVEGEKARDAGWGAGLLTVSLGGGAAQRSFGATLGPLAGHALALLPDEDDAGHGFMDAVALALAGSAGEVRIVQLAGLGAGDDLYDYLAAGHTAADVLQAVAGAPVWAPPPSPAPAANGTGAAPATAATPASPPARPTLATRLIDLAHARGAVFFHTPAGEAFARTPAAGHRETWPVRQRGFRRWLTHALYAADRRAASAQALQEAVSYLESEAVFDGPEHPVGVRVAAQGGRLYLDLADARWRAVEIDATGWRVVDDPPVAFRRPGGVLALPEPAPGGRLADVREFVNVAGEDDFVLLQAYLVGALRATGPYPLLALRGPQGAAKSFTARVVRRLLDPNAAPLRSPPREARDLAITANNGWVVALDNLSGLPDWLSDALCRISTGGGFGTRQLFTDDEEALFDAMRPAIVTGIDDVVLRGDLLDRALLVALPEIDDAKRKTEAGLWARFEAAGPQLLGALLTAVAGALDALPRTTLARTPRLADFAVWVTAAEPAMGLAPGAFVAAYGASRDEGDAVVLEGSAVAQALLRLAGDDAFWAAHGGPSWSGTATALLELLDVREGYTPVVGIPGGSGPRAPRGWPRSASALSGRLRRLAPHLRRAGLAVAFATVGRGAGKQRHVRLDVPPPAPTAPAGRTGTQNGVPSVPSVPANGTVSGGPAGAGTAMPPVGTLFGGLGTTMESPAAPGGDAGDAGDGVSPLRSVWTLCPNPAHAGSAWLRPDGSPVCGACHPRPGGRPAPTGAADAHPAQ